MEVTEQVTALVWKRNSLPEPSRRRALRRISGLTQQELADAIGVDRTAVAHWENGRRSPNGKHLALYLEALGALQQSAEKAA